MFVINAGCAACRHFLHPRKVNTFGSLEMGCRYTLSPFKAERPLARRDSVEKRSS